MLNKCVIMGRLTAAPELKNTSNGTAVVSFTLAVDRDNSGKDKEKQTDFISCVAWRHTAEFISKYADKGNMAVVSGSLQSRKWEDRDGGKHTTWEIISDNFYFAESKRDSGSNTPLPAVSGDEYKSAFSELNEDDGELPF